MYMYKIIKQKKNKIMMRHEKKYCSTMNKMRMTKWQLKWNENQISL